MMTLLRVTLFFWRTYLVRTLLTKRMLVIALGCLLPPAIAWVMLARGSGHPWPIEVFLLPSGYLVLQLLVPLAAIIAGSAVVSEELDDRTITYLLTRPIPRASILLGRWLATLTILIVPIGASVGALKFAVEHHAPTFVPSKPTTIEIPAHHGQEARTRVFDHRPAQALVDAMPGSELPEGLFLSVLVAALLGVTAYSAVIAALSTYFKHPMIIGLAFVGAIEVLLANLPGVSHTWTVQYYLRSYLLSHHPEVWSEVEGIAMQTYATPQEVVTTVLVVTLVALVAGSITITRKQYVMSA